MNRSSNQIDLKVFDDVPKSANTIQTKSIEHEGSNQAKACNQIESGNENFSEVQARVELFVPLLQTSFDPGGKHTRPSNMLQLNCQKELSYPAAHQVFDKIPKSLRGHEPEIPGQLLKGMKARDRDENYAPAEIKDKVQKAERCLISPSTTSMQREIHTTTIVIGIEILPLGKFGH